MVVYNEEKDAFNDPVAIRVSKTGTVDLLKSAVAKLTAIPEAELQLLRIMQGSAGPRSDIFTDGSKRLQVRVNVLIPHVTTPAWNHTHRRQLLKVTAQDSMRGNTPRH